MDDDTLIDCACYTSARRHPEVLGRIGRTVLPFQLTAAALCTGVVTFVALLWSWSAWWHQFVPGVVALIVVTGLPAVVGRLAMVTSLGGRSPFLSAAGVLRYVFRCRRGVVAGRPVGRTARGRCSGRVVMEGRG